eukprot:symbB.v1.2.036974.t1/scaffold5346.1/size28234/2
MMTYTQPGMGITTIEVPAHADKNFYDGMMRLLAVDLTSTTAAALAMGDGGAVGKGKDDDLDNAYELLELEDDAGEKEIKTAYRKISLKCHPDRNPDDEEAAEKFDRLTRAKDLLLDPIRRSELDRKRKAARDLEERHAQEDAKRRKLREDLEGRESAANARSQAYRRAQEDAEARKKYLRQDMAQRIKAKEAELARKQQEVAASVAEVRETALDARLRLTWRGTAPGVETIREELMLLICNSSTGQSRNGLEGGIGVQVKEEALQGSSSTKGGG